MSPAAHGIEHAAPFGMNQAGGVRYESSGRRRARIKRAASGMNKARGRVQHDRHMRICQLVLQG